MTGPPPLTDQERLQRWLTKIAIDPQTGCWMWLAGKDHRGYPVGNKPRGERPRRIYIHRLFYTALVGEIASDVLHHICERPGCVNPQHLLPLSRAEHLKQHPREQRPPATHCHRGHLLDEQNTYVSAEGRRWCRACGRIRANALWAQGRYARQKAAAS